MKDLQMMQLETLIFLLCTSLPIHWLAYYPFWNMLRFSKRTVVGVISISISIKMIIIWAALLHGGDPYLVEYIFAPVHMVIYFVNIREQPFKLLFTYVLLVNYIMLIKGISAFAAVQWLSAAPGSWQDCGICMLFYALSLPFMAYFFRNTTRRVYGINAPVWKTIWLVPGLTSLVVLLFTGDFAEAGIKKWTFLFARMSLLVCVLVVHYILLQSLENLQRQAVMEGEKNKMGQILALQKEQYDLLRDQHEETRRFRHDLRQQLIAARQYLDEGQTEKLSGYLNDLLGSLPEGMRPVSPNHAVNAIALHHQAAARKEGITDVHIHLESIPAHCSQGMESDLCVLIGNLLENAVTACKEVVHPFIQMQSRFSRGILTITMDNRFSAVSRTAEGVFRSTKPGGGIGLLSIQAIAEKYGGGCRLETKEDVFLTSVYLYLENS